MYTPVQFGLELKEKVSQRQDIIKISQWAFHIYLDAGVDAVDWFLDVLLALDKMELGPEFTFTYEELDKIADDLIAGKEIEI